MALLETVGINVRFGGHHAVRDVRPGGGGGWVTGLIGPNGAGKTTTFNAITGLQETAGGKVVLDGEDISALKPHQRARRGIARTSQRLEVFGSLSARENISSPPRSATAGRRQGGRPPPGRGHHRPGGSRAVAEERVDSMPTGLALLVELGRALATRARCGLLDEPASGLDDAESDASPTC